MKRALVFLLVGPASVFFTIRLVLGCPSALALVLFLLLSLLSAIAGLVDGGLARAVPTLMRVPLTAIAGSALAFLDLALFNLVPSQREVVPLAIVVCALHGPVFAALARLSPCESLTRRSQLFPS